MLRNKSPILFPWEDIQLEHVLESLWTEKSHWQVTMVMELWQWLIITSVRIHQMKSFNLFKQKATEHWWRESRLWRMWRSTQWKWWKPCKGWRLPKRIQKKRPVCLQYICVNTCKVMTPSQTAEMQQRWQHRANWATPSLLCNMFTSLVSISSTQIIVVVVVA